MKVLLLKDIKNLGLKGTLKEVSEGYFLNFLKPQGLATAAGSSQVAHMKTQEAHSMQKVSQMKESAEKIRDHLKDKVLTVKGKASETGKLYAALHEKEILAALKTEYRIELKKENLELKEAIKQTGNFELKLKLFKGVEMILPVHVVSE
ncbi:MAG: 50S ribosomal protein L9 [Patescibacteria group bacterium]